METLTFGTATYNIPLPAPYKLKWQLPLMIRTTEDTMVIECPAFDEYGYGKSFDEALKDLGQSIVDFWESLKRLKKRRKNMGKSLVFVFDNMTEYIEEIK